MISQLTLFDRDSDYLEASVKDFNSETASFRVHASLIYKLGESLIADEITALSELIKNSYDADATFCSLSISSDYIEEINGKACRGCIELSDNGCGTCLRSDGQRKLKFASLLEIRDNCQTEFLYSLSCFLEMKKPGVIYHSLKSIPFDILDLCVLNANGQATVVLNEVDSFSEELESCTNNYRIRFADVLETIRSIHTYKRNLNSFLSGDRSITAESAKESYDYLEKIDPSMKEYNDAEMAISFPVRRIARLNELTTIDIVKEYGIVLSRIGHPFDFLKNTTSK